MWGEEQLNALRSCCVCANADGSVMDVPEAEAAQNDEAKGRASVCACAGAAKAFSRCTL